MAWFSLIFPFDLVYIFVLGLAIGSFINVLVDRLAKTESILGRSYCDHCHKKLGVRELIPIVSFIFLKGRCLHCHRPIDKIYPLVELVTGIMFVLSWLYLPAGAGGIGGATLGLILTKIVYLVIISLLTIILFVDLKYQIIPDEIQLHLILATLVLFILTRMTVMGLVVHVAAAVMVMLPILFLFLITKRKGMGFGDVKLGINIGFLLGLKAGLLALYFAFIIGAAVSIFLVVLGGKRLKTKIPFGPFLVAGIFIMMFLPDQIYEIIGRIYGLR